MNQSLDCSHYTSSLDIVSVQFKCCGKFYSCYLCHQEAESHPIEKWKEQEFSLVKAILCRKCGCRMTIAEYIRIAKRCPQCRSLFNPKCEKHYLFYFEKEA